MRMLLIRSNVMDSEIQTMPVFDVVKLQPTGSLQSSQLDLHFGATKHVLSEKLDVGKDPFFRKMDSIAIKFYRKF